MKKIKLSFLLICLLSIISRRAMAQTKFDTLCINYVKQYNELDIPETSLSYKENFKNIKANDELQKQETYFIGFSKQLKIFDIKQLSLEQKLRYHQLVYETSMNLERINLEKRWNNDGGVIPDNGLHALKNYKDWYGYYVKHFTSVNISPEEVFAMGKSEVKKIQHQIKNIETSLGFTDDTKFYNHLNSDTFFLNDKAEILSAYAKIDKIVRQNVSKLFPVYQLPEVKVIEWPNATASTPPGMYIDKENNTYGKDVFQFNFYGHKHNKRSMEWLYMHEAIPGHHLQFIVRNKYSDSSALSNAIFYFGNAEGWACYIEDNGKEMGLYKDNYMYLGKWQWDLVRSARLVMEVGIHYYGWTYDKAMQYWKDNIKGQDEIADREITRITNWAGQALCYKVGALTIKKLVEQQIKKGHSLIEAHRFLLMHSDFPLQVLIG